MNMEAEERAKSSPVASMPSLDHLSRADYEHVYEPSDDTFLFLDALSYEYDKSRPGWRESRRGDATIQNINRTLEVGCGTGAITIHFIKLWQSLSVINAVGSPKRPPLFHHVTDINPHAINVTKRTAAANGIICIEGSLEHQEQCDATNSVLQTWQCDLASALLNDLSKQIDVIFFNPPYVCTPNEEVRGCGIEASWAGGVDGRLVLDRALPQIAQLLAFPHGVAYFISIDENKPHEIAQQMNDMYGIVVEPLMRRKCKNEYLT
eukprot:CAMPEP_0172431956 /NCGR_PEP_ID=MMETSP1064-20121228/60830_1 /TAXON_ID=202472 /ORGANISM="Aulacoseira subarctica , Strain CCAP 1002/5" /LENGTH=263 /DNA_ID=CAMNT_0013178965 /DNA_START=1 /DNA_END=788 /DNA_ORIENTATION=+